MGAGFFGLHWALFINRSKGYKCNILDFYPIPLYISKLFWSWFLVLPFLPYFLKVGTSDGTVTSKRFLNKCRHEVTLHILFQRHRILAQVIRPKRKHRILDIVKPTNIVKTIWFLILSGMKWSERCSTQFKSIEDNTPFNIEINNYIFMHS